MRPFPLLQVLQLAPNEEPVVIVRASRYSCDALVGSLDQIPLTSHGEQEYRFESRNRTSVPCILVQIHEHDSGYRRYHGSILRSSRSPPRRLPPDNILISDGSVGARAPNSPFFYTNHIGRGNKIPLSIIPSHSL